MTLFYISLYFFDMSQLFTWYFWFVKRTPMTPRTMWVVFFFFLAMVVCGAVLAIFGKKFVHRSPLRRRQLRHLTVPAVTCGILGELFLFFHFERASLLALRFWFLLLAIFFLIWMAVRAHRAFFVWPKRMRTAEVDTRAKYLPKRKM